MGNIMKHFPEIYGHLDRVQNYVHDKQIEKNPIFTDDAKSRAEEFCSFLTEKSVHSAINFNLDVQAKLTQESLTFQTRSWIEEAQLVFKRFKLFCFVSNAFLFAGGLSCPNNQYVGIFPFPYCNIFYEKIILAASK